MKCSRSKAAKMIPKKQRPINQRTRFAKLSRSRPFSSGPLRYSRAGIIPVDLAVSGLHPIAIATLMSRTISKGASGVCGNAF